MEKVFVRSKELERALDFETNSCRTKKEQKAFRKYVRVLERAEYLKIAEPYIAETPEKYMRTLISLVNKLNDNQSGLSRAEEERLLQILMLFCTRPKLFFRKASSTSSSLLRYSKKNTVEKDIKEFEQELSRFNRKWASFVAEIQLCKKYMFRGTRDLDRTIENHLRVSSYQIDEVPHGQLTTDEEKQLG